MSEPTENDYHIAAGIAMACSWCGMPWNACSAKREVGQRQSVENTGEALEDDEGFCCEECCHSSRARDLIAAALAAAREEWRRTGLEEAARHCYYTAQSVLKMEHDPRWSPETREAIAHDAEMWIKAADSLRSLIPQEPASATEPTCETCGGPCDGYRRPEPAPASNLTHICAEDFHCCALSSAHECLACKHERPAPTTEPTCDCGGRSCGDPCGGSGELWPDGRPCPACRPQETKP